MARHPPSAHAVNGWRQRVVCGAPGLRAHTARCQACTVPLGGATDRCPNCKCPITPWCQVMAAIGERCAAHAGLPTHPDVPAWALTEVGRWKMLRRFPSAASHYDAAIQATERATALARLASAEVHARLEEDESLDADKRIALMERAIKIEKDAAAAATEHSRATAQFPSGATYGGVIHAPFPGILPPRDDEEKPK